MTFSTAASLSSFSASSALPTTYDAVTTQFATLSICDDSSTRNAPRSLNVEPAFHTESSSTSLSTSSALPSIFGAVSSQSAPISHATQSSKALEFVFQNAAITDSIFETMLSNLFTTTEFDTWFAKVFLPSPESYIKNLGIVQPQQISKTHSAFFAIVTKNIIDHPNPQSYRAKNIISVLYPLVDPHFISLFGITNLTLAIQSRSKKIVSHFCKKGALLNQNEAAMSLSLRLLQEHFGKLFVKEIIANCDVTNGNSAQLLSLLIKEKKTDLALFWCKKIIREAPLWWQNSPKSEFFRDSCASQNITLATYFAQHIDVNRGCKTGDTHAELPLVLAAKNGWTPLVQNLIDRGADPTETDSEKRVYEWIEEGCRHDLEFVRITIQKSNLLWLKEYNNLLLLIQARSCAQVVERLKRELKKAQRDDAETAPWVVDKRRMASVFELALNSGLKEIASLVKSKMEITEGAILAALRNRLIEEAAELILTTSNDATIENSMRACEVTDTFTYLIDHFPFSNEGLSKIYAILNGLRGTSEKAETFSRLCERLFQSGKFLLLSSNSFLMIAQELYRRQATWWLNNQEYRTALLVFAIQEKNGALASFLIEEDLSDAIVALDNEETVILKAAQAGLYSVVSLLLSKKIGFTRAELTLIFNSCSNVDAMRLCNLLLQHRILYSPKKLFSILSILLSAEKTDAAMSLFWQAVLLFSSEWNLLKADSMKSQFFCDLFHSLLKENNENIRNKIVALLDFLLPLVDPSYYDKKNISKNFSLLDYVLMTKHGMQLNTIQKVLDTFSAHPSFLRAIANQAYIYRFSVPKNLRFYEIYLSKFNATNFDITKKQCAILLNILIYIKLQEQAIHICKALVAQKATLPWWGESGIKEALYLTAVEVHNDEVQRCLINEIDVNYCGPNPLCEAQRKSGTEENISPILEAIQIRSEQAVSDLVERGADLSRVYTQSSGRVTSLLQLFEVRFCNNSGFVTKIKKMVRLREPSIWRQMLTLIDECIALALPY